MFCLQLEWTIYLSLLCCHCNLVHAVGVCEFDAILAARRNSSSYSGSTSSDPNQIITDTLTTEYKLTMTSHPTTAITITSVQKSTTAEVGTTPNNLTTKQTRTTKQETTTKDIEITTYDPTTTEADNTKEKPTTTHIQSTTNERATTETYTSEQKTTTEDFRVTTNDPITTEDHTTEQETTTKQIQSTANKRTTTDTYTSERKTTTEDFRVTTNDPITTEAYTTKQKTTTGEHTSLEIHSTKHTTAVRTTEILSTKVTTTDLTTSPPTTLLSCPTNTIYTNCTCQTTCEDPKRLNGCYNNCSGGELCICPDGFYLLEGSCVPPEDCGCYVQNEDVIIQEDDTQLVLNCTQQCSCDNGVLSCNDYQCDTNALCDNRNGTFECRCKDGYHGNGVTCTRLTDCTDVYNAGLVDHGVYKILPTGWTEEAFEVYCKDRWNVFQRREDGSVDFFRYWADYKEGFGDPRRETWLGLEKLFYLTNQGTYELKISLTSDNTPHEISQTSFKISDETGNYRITDLGFYTSTLGTDLMNYHRTFQFSTRDRDNDNHPSVDCAGNHLGGWWYRSCWTIYLNGPYGSPVEPGVCYHISNIRYCNIPFTEMSIRRV